MGKKNKTIFWGDFNQSNIPSLKENTQTKYLIVGGGIAGLSTAYFLLENGERDIVLIEKNTIGSGSTGHSAGMLVCEPETATWTQLVHVYGVDLARKYFEAQVSALRLISQIIKSEEINCDLMPQELLMIADTEISKKHLLRDYQTRLSMKRRVELLSKEDLKKEFASKEYFMAERIEENISVNPLLLARGLAQYLKKRGVRIYEKTNLLSVNSGVAETTSGEINYKQIIKCLGVSDKKVAIDRYLATIAITRRLTESELSSIGLADLDMFIDDERRSFHYGKITANSRLLVGYGDNKCRGKEKENYVHEPHVRNIERFLKRVFPNIKMTISDAWSAEYALSRSVAPVVLFDNNQVTINGSGTQLTSVVSTSYAVSKILKKKHLLDKFFVN